MQVKNPNSAFKPVTVTFETFEEYHAFREILHATNDNCSFDGKEQEVLENLWDNLDMDMFNN